MAREYKDSGIAWIGRIPREWRVCRLKELGFLYGGLTGKSGTDFDVEEDDKFAYFIPFTNIFNNMVIDTNKLYKVKVEDGEMQNEVHQGDLLFLMSSEDYEGIGKPALLDASISHLYLNSFCKGLRIVSDNVVPKFLLYMMTSHIMREQIRLEAKGFIRINLRQEKLMNVSLYLPPISEQQRIASYLDKKCAEIDSLVELQEQMIAQLTDYKQSVITEAVTKGLNPEAELVSSGIDWIGDVPKGWKIARIKNVASLYGRIGFRGYTSDDLNKDGEGAITLSPSNMLPMGMDYSNVTYLSWAKYFESPEIIIQNNDLLMVKTGSSYGKVAYVDNLPKEATINPQILRIVSKISSKYLGYFMQTPIFLYQVEGGVVGGTIPTIAQEKISNFKILLPSENEQNDIVSHLDTKCREIDTLISIKQQKIETLKEYKKSIIFEAVTGKAY